jgi:hypothetical protein
MMKGVLMKKLILIAILIAMIAGSAFAQLAMGGWSSPTSDASQTLYRSTADDFIRPDSYLSAGIDKWFAMTSFASNNTVSIGYANKSEKLFLGLYYGGSFWANITVPNSTETIGFWLGSPDSKVKTYTLAGADPLGTNPNNRIGVLIGVADMGFRLSYYTTYEMFSVNENSRIGANSYASYKREDGIIDPQIAWSMAKNLTDNGIKPWATINLYFYRDYTESEPYDNVAPYDKLSKQVTISQNYFSPELRLGLGGLTVVKKDSFSGAVDLQYLLNIINYDDNQYSYPGDDGKYKTSKFSGYFTGNPDSFTQRAGDIYNTVTPSFTGTWSGEKLGLKFRLNLPLSFNNEKVTQVWVDQTNGALKKGTYDPVGDAPYDGYDRVTDTFGFQPNLQLAARWQLHQKLTLNVGGSIGLGNISVATRKDDIYNDDSKVPNSSSTTVTTTFGTTTNRLYLGAAFTPTDYLTFEAASGVSNNTTNAVNTFQAGTTGLFYFYNLLVSLKF